MNAFDERQNRLGRQRRGVEIADDRGFDRFRHIAAGAVDGGNAAVGEVFRFVKTRHVGERKFGGELGEQLFALAAAIVPVLSRKRSFQPF